MPPSLSWPLRVLLLAALWAVFSFPAEAAPVCGERGDLVRQLRDRYAERAAALGLTAGGAVVEVFVSAAGTRTLMLTLPGGDTCVMAAGTHWQSISEKMSKGVAL